MRKVMAAIIVISVVLAPVSWRSGVVQASEATHRARASKCTIEQGQAYIDEGRYDHAIREFSCVIAAQPTEVEGYRGRIEAELLLSRFSDALRDYTRVTAYVIPVHPDAESTILGGYTDRLKVAPDDIPTLTGLSFAHWYFFNYNQAIHQLNHLLEIRPDDLFATLFRGSSRLLRGVTVDRGVADLERALLLAPGSADVRYIIADAYTYGLPDPQRAFAEASLALDWGLNTPRIHAILASAYSAFGDTLSAADHVLTHIDQVTSELLLAPPLDPGAALSLDLVPGRTYEVPVTVFTGEMLSIRTSSPDYWDTIMVLLGPDGSPVISSDDFKFYLAGFDWFASTGGTYRLLVTFFESVNTGELLVTRG